ncbi:MAG: hypothetical protein QXP50_08480 [Candidatus Methanomethylicia archaeon]
MEEGKLECLNALSNVIEPETGVSALQLGLLRYEIKESSMIIYYRPVSPYTPQVLVIALGVQILKSLLDFKCKDFKIILENYYLSEEINERLEELKNELTQIYG